MVVCARLCSFLLSLYTHPIAQQHTPAMQSMLSARVVGPLGFVIGALVGRHCLPDTRVAAGLEPHKAGGGGSAFRIVLEDRRRHVLPDAVAAHLAASRVASEEARRKLCELDTRLAAVEDDVRIAMPGPVPHRQSVS